MDTLPLELIHQILHLLPLSTHLVLSRLSRYWYDLIYLAPTHTRFYPSPESFQSDLLPFFREFLSLPAGESLVRLVIIGSQLKPQLSPPPTTPPSPAISSYHLQLLCCGTTNSTCCLTLTIRARAYTLIHAPPASHPTMPLRLFLPVPTTLPGESVHVARFNGTIDEAFACPAPVSLPLLSIPDKDKETLTGGCVLSPERRLRTVVDRVLRFEGTLQDGGCAIVRRAGGWPRRMTQYFQLIPCGVGEAGVALVHVRAGVTTHTIPSSLQIRTALWLFGLARRPVAGEMTGDEAGVGYDFKKSAAWRCGVGLVEEARECRGMVERAADLEVVMGGWRPADKREGKEEEGGRERKEEEGEKEGKEEEWMRNCVKSVWGCT